MIAVSTDYGASWSASLSFTFYHSYRPPTFGAISPKYVDRSAVAPPVLEVTGSNFAPTGPDKLQCGFGGTVVVAAFTGGVATAIYDFCCTGQVPGGSGGPWGEASSEPSSSSSSSSS